MIPLDGPGGPTVSSPQTPSGRTEDCDAPSNRQLTTYNHAANNCRKAVARLNIADQQGVVRSEPQNERSQQAVISPAYADGRAG
jgi:hypothetical protein